MMNLKINDKVKFCQQIDEPPRTGIITNIHLEDGTARVFSDKKFFICNLEDLVLSTEKEDASKSKEYPSNERKAHYNAMKITPFDVMRDWPIQQQIGGCRLFAVKYLMRLGFKDNALKEAEKALDCTKALVQVLRGEEIDLDEIENTVK